MVEESMTMTSVAATPPNVRMAPLAKFAPVTTTDVPPSVVPLAGVSPITLSAVGEGPVDPHPDAASTDNSTVAAVCVRPIQVSSLSASDCTFVLRAVELSKSASLEPQALRLHVAVLSLPLRPAWARRRRHPITTTSRRSCGGCTEPTVAPHTPSLVFEGVGRG